MAYARLREVMVALGVAGGLVFATSSASAFQEETTTSSGAISKSDSFDPALDLGAGSGVQQKEQGTVIRIPGVGKLGVLPKLDFGLELLYSNDDSKAIDNDAFQSDDVFIRGSIKRRF